MLYAVVTLQTSDVDKRDRELLKKWAARLKISVNQLLKRILLAAINGERYVEKMPA